jgi:PAS domain-containing protein
VRSPRQPEARDRPVNLPPPLLRSGPAAAPSADLSPSTLELIDVVDAGGRIVWANEAEAAALGYPEEALTGRDVETLFEPAAAAFIRAALRSPPGPAGASAELDMRRKDGARLRTLGRVLASPGGLTLLKTPLGALAARLERLEAENRLLRRIADAGHEAHWCIEFAEPIPLTLPEDEIVFRVFSRPSYWRLCNQAMSRLYGLPHQVDLADQSVRLYWPRSAPNEAFVRQIIAADYSIDGAVSVDHRHDGTQLVVENDVRADIEDGCLVRLWGNCRPLGVPAGGGS